jgi:hypothetical protein
MNFDIKHNSGNSSIVLLFTLIIVCLLFDSHKCETSSQLNENILLQYDFSKCYKKNRCGGVNLNSFKWIDFETRDNKIPSGSAIQKNVIEILKDNKSSTFNFWTSIQSVSWMKSILLQHNSWFDLEIEFEMEKKISILTAATAATDVININNYEKKCIFCLIDTEIKTDIVLSEEDFCNNIDFGIVIKHQSIYVYHKNTLSSSHSGSTNGCLLPYRIIKIENDVTLKPMNVLKFTSDSSGVSIDINNGVIKDRFSLYDYIGVDNTADVNLKNIDISNWCLSNTGSLSEYQRIYIGDIKQGKTHGYTLLPFQYSNEDNDNVYNINPLKIKFTHNKEITSVVVVNELGNKSPDYTIEKNNFIGVKQKKTNIHNGNKIHSVSSSPNTDNDDYTYDRKRNVFYIKRKKCNCTHEKCPVGYMLKVNTKVSVCDDSNNHSEQLGHICKKNKCFFGTCNFKHEKKNVTCKCMCKCVKTHSIDVGSVRTCGGNITSVKERCLNKLYELKHSQHHGGGDKNIGMSSIPMLNTTCVDIETSKCVVVLKKHTDNEKKLRQPETVLHLSYLNNMKHTVKLRHCTLDVISKVIINKKTSMTSTISSGNFVVNWKDNFKNGQVGLDTFIVMLPGNHSFAHEIRIDNYLNDTNILVKHIDYAFKCQVKSTPLSHWTTSPMLINTFRVDLINDIIVTQTPRNFGTGDNWILWFNVIESGETRDIMKYSLNGQSVTFSDRYNVSDVISGGGGGIDDTGIKYCNDTIQSMYSPFKIVFSYEKQKLAQLSNTIGEQQKNKSIVSVEAIQLNDITDESPLTYFDNDKFKQSLSILDQSSLSESIWMYIVQWSQSKTTNTESVNMKPGFKCKNRACNTHRNKCIDTDEIKKTEDFYIAIENGNGACGIGSTRMNYSVETTSSYESRYFWLDNNHWRNDNWDWTANNIMRINEETDFEFNESKQTFETYSEWSNCRRHLLFGPVRINQCIKLHVLQTTLRYMKVYDSRTKKFINLGNTFEIANNGKMVVCIRKVFHKHLTMTLEEELDIITNVKSCNNGTSSMGSNDVHHMHHRNKTTFSFEKCFIHEKNHTGHGCNKHQWNCTINPLVPMCLYDSCGVCNGDNTACTFINETTCPDVIINKKKCVLNYNRCFIHPPIDFPHTKNILDVLNVTYRINIVGSMPKMNVSRNHRRRRHHHHRNNYEISKKYVLAVKWDCLNKTTSRLLNRHLKKVYEKDIDISWAKRNSLNNTECFKYFKRRIVHQDVPFGLLYTCSTGVDYRTLTMETLANAVKKLKVLVISKMYILSNTSAMIDANTTTHMNRKLIYKTPCEFIINTDVKNPCQYNGVNDTNSDTTIIHFTQFSNTKHHIEISQLNYKCIGKDLRMSFEICQRRKTTNKLHMLDLQSVSITDQITVGNNTHVHDENDILDVEVSRDTNGNPIVYYKDSGLQRCYKWYIDTTNDYFKKPKRVLNKKVFITVRYVDNRPHRNGGIVTLKSSFDIFSNNPCRKMIKHINSPSIIVPIKKPSGNKPKLSICIYGNTDCTTTGDHFNVNQRIHVLLSLQHRNNERRCNSPWNKNIHCSNNCDPENSDKIEAIQLYRAKICFPSNNKHIVSHNLNVNDTTSYSCDGTSYTILDIVQTPYIYLGGNVWKTHVNYFQGCSSAMLVSFVMQNPNVNNLIGFPLYITAEWDWIYIDKSTDLNTLIYKYGKYKNKLHNNGQQNGNNHNHAYVNKITRQRYVNRFSGGKHNNFHYNHEMFESLRKFVLSNKQKSKCIKHTGCSGGDDIGDNFNLDDQNHYVSSQSFRLTCSGGYVYDDMKSFSCVPKYTYIITYIFSGGKVYIFSLITLIFIFVAKLIFIIYMCIRKRRRRSSMVPRKKNRKDGNVTVDVNVNNNEMIVKNKENKTIKRNKYEGPVEFDDDDDGGDYNNHTQLLTPVVKIRNDDYIELSGFVNYKELPNNVDLSQTIVNRRQNNYNK